MYFLILYQGLRKKIFYWEFVNSLRKVLILIAFATLVTVNDIYKIGVSIVVMVITSRLQINLAPYKNPVHSEIEMMAIISGTLTLFSGMIFTHEDKVDFLDTALLVCIIAVNARFILQWSHLFSLTMSERFKFFAKVSMFSHF